MRRQGWHKRNICMIAWFMHHSAVTTVSCTRVMLFKSRHAQATALQPGHSVVAHQEHSSNAKVASAAAAMCHARHSDPQPNIPSPAGALQRHTAFPPNRWRSQSHFLPTVVTLLSTVTLCRSRASPRRPRCWCWTCGSGSAPAAATRAAPRCPTSGPTCPALRAAPGCCCGPGTRARC